MFPFYLPFIVANSMSEKAFAAHRATLEASVASFNKLARQQERPTDAAARASRNAKAGAAKSWYRRPAPSWFEVATGFAASHPAFDAVWATPQLGFPGIGFARPGRAASPGGAAAVGPFDALFSLTMALPQILMALPSMTAHFHGPQTAQSLTPFSSLSLGPDEAERSSSSVQSSPINRAGAEISAHAHSANAHDVRPAHGRHQEITEVAKIELVEGQDQRGPFAVASLTMPDNTVYKIAVPVLQHNAMATLTAFFWPFAFPYAAYASELTGLDVSPNAAQQPEIVETSAEVSEQVMVDPNQTSSTTDDEDVDADRKD